jgi:hypothetical protein
MLMSPIHEEPSMSPSVSNPSSSNQAPSNPPSSNTRSRNPFSSNPTSASAPIPIYPSSSSSSSSAPPSSDPRYIPPASSPIPIQKGTWNGCICCQPGGANVPHSIRMLTLKQPPGTVLCSDCGGKSIDGVCGSPYHSDNGQRCLLTYVIKASRMVPQRQILPEQATLRVQICQRGWEGGMDV